MQIKRFRVSNFAAFEDSGWIELSPGVNLIVGQNNSGKSALLQAFDYPFANKRHRTLERWRPEQLLAPEAEFDIDVSGQQFLGAILRTGGQFGWPIESLDNETELEGLNAYLNEPSVEFQVLRRPENEFQSRRTPTHGRFEGDILCSLIMEPANGELRYAGRVRGRTDELSRFFQELWISNVFFFGPQRYSTGRSGFSHETRLRRDAGNLPAVLLKLQGERGSLFDDLVLHLREIFPTVQNLSVTSTNNNELEILVWPTKEQNQRELSFGLNDSGTGVAQVIAILAVVISLERGVIVIDEINSFLHPAAAKALLRIIQTRYSHHQLIISTHSPDVISAANPSTVHIVKREGYISAVTPIDIAQIDQLREVADHLGVSMTDVFGAERVIWVEGKTEEQCFPFLISQILGEVPRGLTVTPVIATGDFSARRRGELIFEIYDRISRATQPLVKSVIFSFDREDLSKREIQDLSRRASNQLKFLPRRHFECFLLDPSAISFVMNEDIGGEEITSANVRNYLTENAGNIKFRGKESWGGDISDRNWLSKVDAAKLLEAAFSDLSEGRVSFTKTRHSFGLLKRIMLTNKDSVQELLDYIKELLDSASGDDP